MASPPGSRRLRRGRRDDPAHGQALGVFTPEGLKAGLTAIVKTHEEVIQSADMIAVQVRQKDRLDRPADGYSIEQVAGRPRLRSAYAADALRPRHPDAAPRG